MGETQGNRKGKRVRRVAVLAVVLLAGCAMLKGALQFQEPQVDLKQINITGLGLTGGTLDLVFDVFKSARGNCAKAARLFDTTERILGYAVRKHRLDPNRFR